MHSPMEVTNAVLHRAQGDAPINLVQLQRILYFAASEYAKAHGHPMLDEQFQAWKIGPALASVHNKFSVCRAYPIDVRAKDASGTAYASADPRVLDAIETIWRAARGASGATLSFITRLDGSPWAAARRASALRIDDDALAADTTYLEPLGLRPAHGGATLRV